jgi:hypothetical protein
VNRQPTPTPDDDPACTTPAGRPGDDDIDDDGQLSVADPVLRKTRLLAAQCATCIFRPGNPMHLEPGRLKNLIDSACRQAGYIICHSTLPYAGSPIPPAICRGFTDRYTTWQLQLIERLWGFIEVPPPPGNHHPADQHRPPPVQPNGD